MIEFVVDPADTDRPAVALSVYRAQDTGTHRTPTLTIVAVDPFPDGYDTAPAAFATDGKAIADALVATLPGGTLGQVLRALLEHHASRLVVPVGPVPVPFDSAAHEAHLGAAREELADALAEIARLHTALAHAEAGGTDAHL